jgi:hypothetical protein
MAEQIEERIKEAASKAETKFWEAVAQSFPEAQYGDLPPEVAVQLSLSMERAIRSWVELNIDQESLEDARMRQARFVIDFLGDLEFEGYTRGEDWNGFACPYFSFDQAQKIVDAWIKSGSNASYDSANDIFSFLMHNGETDSFSAIDYNGMKIYPIGNGCWIWSEVNTE